MELGLPGGVVQEQVEVLVEGEAVAAGWEEHALELVPAVVVSAPTAGQRSLIK